MTNTIEEVDKILFDKIMELLNTANPLMIFNDTVQNGKLFESFNNIIKHYMKVVDKTGYFNNIKNNKEYFKSLKKLRRNLGENNYKTLFTVRLNNTYKNKNYNIEMKNTCSVDILYDSLVRNKSYKIPTEISLEFIQLIDVTENPIVVFKHGNDISKNMVNI